GPLYPTWVTSFVLLVLFFLYGMWYGLVYRRWSLVGLVAFIAAQVLVALAVVVVVTLTHNWTAFGHFFTTLQAPALTGVLAALSIALGLGGVTTLRRGTHLGTPRATARLARRLPASPAGPCPPRPFGARPARPVGRGRAGRSRSSVAAMLSIQILPLSMPSRSSSGAREQS